MMRDCEVGEDFVQWQQPREPESRPRLPPRLFHLALAAPIALLPLWWLAAEHELMDRTLVGLLLVLAAAGFLWARKALFADTTRLQQVRLDARGLQVAFTHVPGLLQHRTNNQRFVPWTQVRRVKFRKVPDSDVALSAWLHEPLGSCKTEFNLGSGVPFDAGWVAKVLSLMPEPIQQSAKFENWGAEWRTGDGFAEWVGEPFRQKRGIPPRLGFLGIYLLQAVITSWLAYRAGSAFEPLSWLGLVLIVMVLWAALAWGAVIAALVSDFFELHRLRVSRDGMEFDFSRVPGLFRYRQEACRAATWEEVRGVEFRKGFSDPEGPSSHYAFAVRLRRPLARMRRKLSVSTHGHFERQWFEHVLAMLPAHLAKTAKFAAWNQDEPASKTA